MNASRTAVAAAAGCAAAAAAAFLLLGPATAPEPQPTGALLPAGHPFAAAPPARADAATALALAELQQRVAGLETEWAELRLRGPATAAPTGALPAAPASHGGEPAGGVAARPAAPPALADIEAGDRILADAREAAFRSEGVDARWSGATAASVQQALSAADGIASAVRTLECRSRTCRVEIGAASAAQADGLMPELANRLAGTLTSIAASHADAGDGSRSMVLFLSR